MLKKDNKAEKVESSACENTLFDKIPSEIVLKTERLTITEIKRQDTEDYARLYQDENLNKWWGYDYREDLGDNTPSPEFFFEFQRALKITKEEYSFAVRLDGKMIGELVLHNFDCFLGVEMGFRFFSEFQKKGYAVESATRLKEFVFDELNAKTLYSRCFKQNINSKNLIERLGLTQYKEDKTHYYFSLDNRKK